jgi:hypothetical protein
MFWSTKSPAAWTTTIWCTRKTAAVAIGPTRTRYLVTPMSCSRRALIAR